MSLLAAVVHFSSERSLAMWLGRAGQAWLLDQVRRADPALAESLHSGQSRRPYTVSVPRGDDQDRWLRITSVSADLSAVLIGAALPQPGDTIRLANAEVQVASVEIQGHSWAGQSSFEQLAREAFDDEDHESRLSLEFATPTAFHRDGLTMPMPLPPLVYASLIRAWNTFSPLPLPVPLSDFVERYVGIAQHRITTRMVQFGETERHVGFVGTTRYMVMPQARTDCSGDEYRQRVRALDLLTRFAFYAGVGARTAVGMGQARPRE